MLHSVLQVLDDNRELFISETQEVVQAHPRFMLFGTQNPPGLYAGRKVGYSHDHSCIVILACEFQLLRISGLLLTLISVSKKVVYAILLREKCLYFVESTLLPIEGTRDFE